MPAITIDVKSAGFAVGKTAAFSINGQPVDMSYSRGLNVVVIDPTTSHAMNSKTFDTCGSSEASDAFASLIEGLPVGFIVGVAIMDEGSLRLSDRARRACEMIGSALIHNLKWRGSWGLVGQKGAALGSALEALDNTQMVQFTTTQPLPTPEQLTYRVRAYSAAYDVGNTFWIEINGRQLPTSVYPRGLNVVVIDAQTCQVVSQHNFDTWASWLAADQFGQLIDGLPLGQFVAVAVMDEAAANLTPSAKWAIEQLGSGLINQLQFRNSFALIGQKGAPFGSAAESLSNSMPVMCEAWLSPRPKGWEGFAVSTICAMPQTGSLCSTYVDGVPVGSLPSSTSGLLLTVIDEKTGVKLQSVNLDPQQDSTASAALANLLLSIPTGRVVVISATQGAASHLNNDALNACTLVGSAQILNANSDPSACWCIIGRKGSAPGSVPECYGRCATSIQYWFLPGSTTRRRVYADVRLSSAGYNVGDSSIAVNGHELCSCTRGLNVAVFDQDTGNVLKTATYDTYNSTQESDQFAALIESLPVGRLAAITAMDDATSNLTERAKQACESIGSSHIRQLAFRGSWAIIGVKGAPVGTVAETLGAIQHASLVKYQLFTGSAKQYPGIAVRVYSAGFDTGNAAFIDVNNQRVTMSYSRGLNVVLIDRATGHITGQQTFDTFTSTTAANDFAALIEGLPFGIIVAVAVLDDASSQLNERGKRACRMIGSASIYQLGYQNSWAIVGMKGTGAGSATEALSTNGAVSIESWIPLSSTSHVQPLWLWLAFLGIVGVVVILVIFEYHILRANDPQTPSFDLRTLRPATTRKALLVAIDYTGMPGLDIGNSATSAMASMQSKIINGGYITTTKDIVILTDLEDKKNVSTVKVKTALQELVSGAKAGDVLYFYFFGHGASITTPSGRRSECIRLLNEDGTATANFYDFDLAAIIDSLPPKTNLTMVFNSCHSGGMTDYVPYPPKRGITLASVPWNLTSFFSLGFSQYLSYRLGKYIREKNRIPSYKSLIDEITQHMIKDGITSAQLPQLMCDAQLYNVNTLGFLQPIP